jgi:RHS repeat-associated protein
VDSSDFAQYINYSYNERGWLRTSGAYLFSMTLDYNSGPGPQYNGNISSQLWGTFFNENNRFNYTYDRLNRLVSGITTDGNFIERGISYDVMGNITKLSRVFKGVLIDSLSYNYLSASNATNQLQSITDYSPDNGITGYKAGSYVYTYDANGNMTTDNSKGIAIAYNLLNLPQTVTGNKTITYTYDAAGNKLRRVSTGTGTTDYINGIQYDETSGAETLTFIQTEEGRALPNGATGYNYEYNLADNLGNVRISFDTGTGNARLVQQDDYLPFGLEINYTSLNPKNEYLYNKKELQEETGIYDYGARGYDPVTGRWNVVDPMAEKSRRWSPYNYVMNNPIRLIDPDGMDWKDPNDKKTADRLQKDIGNKVVKEQKTVESKTKDIGKLAAKIALGGGSSKDVSKLNSAAGDLSAAKTNISNLNASSSELNQMGDTKAMTFTFNYVTGAAGNTGPAVNGLITMNVVAGNEANEVHEATHAFDFWKGTQGTSISGTEVKPYQRQYSFDSGSVIGLTSATGSISNINDINQNWVKGLNYTDKNGNQIFPYAP